MVNPVCPIQKRRCPICRRETTHVLGRKGAWLCLEESTHRFQREEGNDDELLEATNQAPTRSSQSSYQEPIP